MLTGASWLRGTTIEGAVGEIVRSVCVGILTVNLYVNINRRATLNNAYENCLVFACFNVSLVHDYSVRMHQCISLISEKNIPRKYSVNTWKTYKGAHPRHIFVSHSDCRRTLAENNSLTFKRLPPTQTWIGRPAQYKLDMCGKALYKRVGKMMLLLVLISAGLLVFLTYKRNI